MENERNQEMEEICAAAVDGSNTPVDESTFSFPSSAVEDLWHDHFDDDIDETDQDRTLTTLTLHTTSSPPDSAMKHYYNTADSSHLHQDMRGNNGYYRISQDGSSSGIFSNNSGMAGTSTLFTPFQQHHQQQQQRFSLMNNGASSYTFPNGTSQDSHDNSHSHHNGSNGGIMGNGNGTLSGAPSFYTGYSRTTAV